MATMNQDRLRKALLDLVYLPSLRETAAAQPSEAQPGYEQLSAVKASKDAKACRPWHRQDLYERLRTFKVR